MTTSVYISDPVQLTASAATYGIVVPALTKRVIRSASVTNTTGAPVALTVYLVPLGGTAAAANTIISARTIAVGETYNCPELVGKGINAGGFLQALGLNLTLAYTATDIQ
jgi:hypothetical protein